MVSPPESDTSGSIAEHMVARRPMARDGDHSPSAQRYGGLLEAVSAWHDGDCVGGTQFAPPRRRHKERSLKENSRQAADAAEDVTNSHALELLARAGFAASGILHFLVGAIAIRLAMGGTGNADFSGAVAELASQPAGPFLLWASFAACAALAVWQTSDAIFDLQPPAYQEKSRQKRQSSSPGTGIRRIGPDAVRFCQGPGVPGRQQAVRYRPHPVGDGSPRRRGTAGPGRARYCSHRGHLRHPRAQEVVRETTHYARQPKSPDRRHRPGRGRLPRQGRSALAGRAC